MSAHALASFEPSKFSVARWVTTMSEFEYTVEYYPGDSKSLDTGVKCSVLVTIAVYGQYARRGGAV